MQGGFTCLSAKSTPMQVSCYIQMFMLKTFCATESTTMQVN